MNIAPAGNLLQTCRPVNFGTYAMCLAIPVKIIELLPDDMARVALDGVYKIISLALIEGAQIGDYVILHVGYALQRLDPDEAAQTLALFAELESKP